MEPDLILSVLRAFEAFQVRYALVGGVAMNIQGLPRATADIDIVISAEPDNVARLRAALDSLFHDPAIAEITAEDLNGRYPAIQYVPPDGTFHIDILARLGERFSFADIETEERLIEGVRCQVATPRMLYRMKKDTVRLRDRADAERLRERFNLED